MLTIFNTLYVTQQYINPTLYEGWFDPSRNESRTLLTPSDLLEVVYEELREHAYVKAYKDEKDEYDDK
eukprot:5330987-Ditylum_brightwellii.AAC.1